MAEKIMVILGTLGIGYFIGIVLYAGLSSKFPFIWLAAGIAFYIMAFLIHKRIQIPFGVKTGGVLLLAAAGVVFVCVELLIAAAMLQKPDKELDYLIVLGAQVKGDVPSLSLKYRIDAAGDYLRENKETKAVLSGGKGPGENISEAECMYRELLLRGIEKERLIKEDKSVNTSENIEFSYRILQDRHKNGTEKLKTGIVTNGFHVFRGTAIARKKMNGKIQGIPAKSNKFLLVNYMVREFLGVLKDRAAGNL